MGSRRGSQCPEGGYLHVAARRGGDLRSKLPCGDRSRVLSCRRSHRLETIRKIPPPLRAPRGSNLGWPLPLAPKERGPSRARRHGGPGALPPPGSSIGRRGTGDEGEGGSGGGGTEMARGKLLETWDPFFQGKKNRLKKPDAGGVVRSVGLREVGVVSGTEYYSIPRL
jgi:hypothetical protein